MRISDWSSDVCSSDLAPATKLLASMEVESSVSSRLERVLGLSAVSGSRLPGKEPTPADTATLRLAREQGFIIERIAPQSNLLEVRLPFIDRNSRHMDALLPLKEQIAWIDISDGNIRDEDLATVGDRRRVETGESV